MVDLKKDILLYGSDKVFFAYNNFLIFLLIILKALNH